MREPAYQFTHETFNLGIIEAFLSKKAAFGEPVFALDLWLMKECACFGKKFCPVFGCGRLGY
jgi:hypothetical protein